MSKITRCATCVAVGAVISASTAAIATPITYTETAIGSGTLNGNAFSNVAITLTGTGDTAAVFSQNGQFGNTISLTIDISGVGTATYNGGPVPFAFDNPGTNAVGFAISSGAVLGIVNSAFGSYDLKTAIGPIAGVALFDGPSLSTDLGTLVLANLGGANRSATFSAAPAAVPGPIVGAGIPGLVLACFGLMAWWRSRRAAA